MNKAITTIFLIFSLYALSQEPSLATTDLHDSTEIRFNIRMDKIETPCLSSGWNDLHIWITGDTTAMILDLKYLYDTMVCYLIPRNILNDMIKLEFDLIDNRCDEAGYIIFFNGPVHHTRYVTCNKDILEEWLKELKKN